MQTDSDADNCVRYTLRGKRCTRPAVTDQGTCTYHEVKTIPHITTTTDPEPIRGNGSDQAVSR